MRDLRFWKRERKPATRQGVAPINRRFGIRPRTDVGELSMPGNPDVAARAAALQNRREALAHELRIAEEANGPDSSWRREIALIGEALGAIERERAALDDLRGIPGDALPLVPIADITVTMDPAVSVRFRVGESEFAYAEELDWAERGTQITISDLHREKGDIASLVPRDFPPSQRSALIQHLEGSLFGFATALRDRAIEGQAMPCAALADLATPSGEYGGWLDWSGQSPIAQARQLELHRLRGEQDRLERERANLLDEEAKAVETIPVIRRRLADVDQQLASLIEP